MPFLSIETQERHGIGDGNADRTDGPAVSRKESALITIKERCILRNLRRNGKGNEKKPELQK